MAMNQWFRKGNSRRFYRIDMPVRYFIVPTSPIKDREIYATGANYFPSSFHTKVAGQKLEAMHWINRIQEHSELLIPVFEEIVDYVEFFGRCALSISEGSSPKSDPGYWMEIKDRLQGFKKAVTLNPSSPKTYQYLQMIEEKYLAFLKHLVNSIDQSTPTKFYVEGHLPLGFKIDEMMSVFSAPKFAKIPLVQTLLHISEYMDSYLETYRLINDDNFLRQHPDDWKQKMANVSASGIAVHLGKRFPQYEKVDVLLYFPEDDRIIEFAGSVVDTRTDEVNHTERVAINFEFPDGNDQDYLQLQIQKQEVKECMNIAL